MRVTLNEMSFYVGRNDAVGREVGLMGVSVQLSINPILAFWILESSREYFGLPQHCGDIDPGVGRCVSDVFQKGHGEPREAKSRIRSCP
jgi:hypothetical protein